MFTLLKEGEQNYSPPWVRFVPIDLSHAHINGHQLVALFDHEEYDDLCTREKLYYNSTQVK